MRNQKKSHELPRNSAKPIKDTAPYKLHEQPITSPWYGNNDKVTPYLLPLQFGDGEQKVILSFRSFPSVCVIVLFDSNLPPDLPMEERCEQSETIRCFRDALNEIYEGCRDIYLTKEKEKQIFLASELEEDEFEAWQEIIRDGSCWC